MTEKRKRLMLDKAKRLYDDIDNHLQKEHAIEWFGKNAATLRNARENLEFVIMCLDKLNGTFCHREGCFVVASAKCKLWEN